MVSIGQTIVISIHAPTRGATKSTRSHSESRRFQSTLPREERQNRGIAMSLVFFYFNPRSHERSDPAGRLDLFRQRFQSTLPREERLSLPEQWDQRMYFNPRSHERSDDSCRYMRLLFKISIHAPTRGATQPGEIRNDSWYFNPRSHERSDTYTVKSGGFKKEFQSTLPREERQQYCTKNLFIFIQYRQ